MKYLMIAAFTATFTASVLADNRETKFPEHFGFGSGATVGALVAGPVGFLVGGTLGVLMGHDVVQERVLARKNKELVGLNETILESGAKLVQIKARYAKTEAEIFELQNLLSDLSTSVHFASDSSMTAERYREALIAIARASAKLEGMQINLIGHADASGSDAYNQILSEMRAKSVSLILNNAGIPEGAISRQGYGESEALANGQCGYYALDRRVDLYISFDQDKTDENFYSIR